VCISAPAALADILSALMSEDFPELGSPTSIAMLSSECERSRWIQSTAARSSCSTTAAAATATARQNHDAQLKVSTLALDPAHRSTQQLQQSSSSSSSSSSSTAS
jgi:hypothetical protein